MQYIVVEIGTWASTMTDVLYGLKAGKFIGAYDNLMLLSKHIYDNFGYDDVNSMVNSRQRIHEDIVEKTQLYSIMKSSKNCSIIIVCSNHKDLNNGDFNFIKAYLRNDKINKLLLD